MSDILFEAVKLLVMVAVLVITRYVIPWIRSKIENDKLTAITEWARIAVLAAQQIMTTKDGAEKKAIVTEFLKEILTDKNIALSDYQLDILIEAAVKQMKMSAPMEGILAEAGGDMNFLSDKEEGVKCEEGD